MSLNRSMRRAAAGVSDGGFEFWDPSSAGGSWVWDHAYDAAGPNMSAVYSDTDPVTGAWLDEVGAFDVSRVGGGTLTYNAADAGLNSQAAIDFDGTGRFEADIGAGIAQPVSVVTVHQSDSAAGRSDVTDGVNVGSSHTTGHDNGVFLRITAGVNLRGNAATTNAIVCVTVADGASSLIREDGVTTNTGNVGTASLRPLSIGGESGGGNEFNGRIAAVGIFDGDVTSQSGFTTWESALITHYGI